MVKSILTVLIALSFYAANVFVEEGYAQGERKGSAIEHEDKGSIADNTKTEASSAVEATNNICPVSGEKIGGMMGPGAQYEYKGKIYNFCCAGCIETFKKDPEKYVKIIEASTEQQNVKGESHDHSKHKMGEMDSHAVKDMHGEKESHPGAVSEEPESTKEEVREIRLEAYQHGYSPEKIVVKKGTVVKLFATSRDVPHGVFIKEYGINEKVEKGKVKEITFVADKAGEFDIICSVYCGRGHHSMKSKLVVEE